jgi:hypothetical protein
MVSNAGLLKTIDREIRFMVPTATEWTSSNTICLGGDPGNDHIGPRRC